ncbi:hypothetical protein TWF281_007595 [Arthrobotrys megalospora]
MERSPYSKDMYAPRELNYKPTVRANNDFRKVTNPRKIPAGGPSKRKGPVIPHVKPALQRMSLESAEPSPRKIPEAGFITPQRTPNGQRSTRWPGMFRTGTPDRTPNLSIPPWNPAFENPRKPIVPGKIRELANLSINICVNDHKHMVCNPKWNTPKPWRDALQRMFDGITLDSNQKEYIEFYTLGYIEGAWPKAAPVSLMEQAFMFGVMEKQWDLEVENSLYRFYHSISDEGVLKGTRHYFHGDLD